MLCSSQATVSSLLKLNLKSTACLTRIGQTRTMMKPKISLPYRGIYRTEGDMVKKDDILVNQGKMNYHPGLNVYFERDRSERLLKASCDGRVMISRELADVDWTHPEMELNYGHRKDQPLYKLTFNVLPDKMSQSFKLVDEI